MLNRKWFAVLSVLILNTTALVGFTQDKVNKIHWMSVEEAVAATQKEPRKIMIDVYTQWCGPCKMMAAQTFTHPDVVKYMNEKYYCVKFDAESGDSVRFDGKTFKNPGFKPGATGRNSVHDLTMHWGVSAYPTLLFFDETAKAIAPITGFQSVENFEIFAKVFAQNDYKTIQTQEDWANYQKNFVRTWNVTPAPEKKSGPAPAQEIIAMSDTLLPDDNIPVAVDEPVLDIAEVNPEYLGDVYMDISKNVVYPERCKEEGIQGTVYVKFVVNKEGMIEDVKIMKGVKGGAELEIAAIQAVRKLGKFKPAMQNGKTVKCTMTLPIKFALQ
jgi:TonB family protein